MDQTDFVILECEECHEEMSDGQRRRRCTVSKNFYAAGAFITDSIAERSTEKKYEQKSAVKGTYRTTRRGSFDRQGNRMPALHRAC